MSRLKNAPLLEVVFELKWPMTTKEDWSKYPYLHGDLFSLLKNEYSVRELLTPMELPAELLINRPVYRVKSEKGYPLYQVGPGLITLNTTDNEYDWPNYFMEVKTFLRAFLSVHKFGDAAHVNPSLSYFDFFKIDWDRKNVLSFIKDNLSIDFAQKFYETQLFPHTFGWNIGYKSEVGNVILNINTGINKKNEKGLILQTRIEGNKCAPEIMVLETWLEEAHQFCSTLFKNLTKGELYKSFT